MTTDTPQTSTNKNPASKNPKKQNHLTSDHVKAAIKALDLHESDKGYAPTAAFLVTELGEKFEDIKVLAAKGVEQRQALRVELMAKLLERGVQTDD